MKKLSNFGLWIYIIFLLVIAGCVSVSVPNVESSTPEKVVVNWAMAAEGPSNVQRGSQLAEIECEKYGKRVVSETPCSKFLCYKSQVTYECGD